ncbi:hypothetical protein ATCVCanal1_289L [Acanthocystis turfacea Chlorella virus Canal-1]|nr:hypothetical protein ATCVCanal1_289L [Acanthocystis turfacea Chlorella virus Canal-1]
MFFASINEAFGVDSLEKTEDEVAKNRPKTMKTERASVSRTKFPTEDMVGEDIGDDDSYELPTVIPEERKLTDLEVRRYISKMYTKGGLKKVWALLDPKIRKKILTMCNKTVENTNKWFEDLLSSPEKLLILLAIIFVIILLLDSTSSKAEVPAQTFRPMEQVYYYPPQAMSTAPNGPELRW